ncbi:hypothetical protein [Devosia sp. A16]|uniref:hypothetical protein n=1 Tax=Devosia sp. A16 TaxID=1736675 RepID=UPI0006D82DAA|nr:hypothetical protein [Devosia sp. A16]
MFNWLPPLQQGPATIGASLLFIVLVFLIARVARLSQPLALAVALTPPMAVAVALERAFASGLI